MDIFRRNFIRATSSALALGLATGSPLQLARAAQQTTDLTSAQPEEQRRGDMIRTGFLLKAGRKKRC